MPNNYDAAAWFYDALSQLVFGNKLIESQRFLVQQIMPEAKILIVGGGTGWILEELTRVQPSTLKITYVEISARMICLSKQKYYGQNEVVFVNLPIEDFMLTENYNIILTPFLFDNFSEKRIRAVFKQLHQSLKPGGLWLLADFQVQKNYAGIWQQILLKTMYWFFGWLCSVETKQLTTMRPVFLAENYQLSAEKTFYQGFIISQVYRKQF
ncbi:MAG: methyltransferase domain-containing protein [Sphingobacteriaceae bacterium]|nr:MAG: methyltransferase domain-containing protein [Sphingobacteriaceae bacterium]